MPWCPKCKSEYREGFKVCADCGCELVEEMPANDKTALTFGTEEEMSRLAEFLEYSGIGGVEIQYDETESSYDLSVDSQDLEKAAVVMRVFLVKEREQKAACGQGDGSGEEESAASDAPADEPEDTGDSEEDGSNGEAARKLQEAVITRRTLGGASLYQDSSTRADDNRSSAWVLTITGFLGIAVVVLGLTGVLPFQVGNPYLVYGVMGVIFLLFVIAGFVSMKNAKFFARKAESENSLRSTMLDWCKTNLKADEIDRELSCESESAELQYFNRCAYLKERLNRQFINLDQNFLDQFIDDQVYDMVFGETAYNKK